MQVWLESKQDVRKRLFVLGGTGATGRAVIGQALKHGHQVTAFVRSPQKLAEWRDRIRIVSGDVFRAEELAAAMVNHDAVVSTLGHRGHKPSTMLHDAAKATVNAMHRSEVGRLLIVSVGLLFEDTGMIAALLRSTIFRDVVEDSDQMEQVVRQSELDWTIVRPPRLTNGPVTRRVATAVGRLPVDTTPAISRADLACYLLKEAECPASDRCVVGMGLTREGMPALAPSRSVR